VASPFSRNRHDGGSARVIGSVFDHTSVLKFIEWRWNLVPLTPRDASDDINNLAHVFDFDRPEFSVPELPNPIAPPPQACGPLDFAAPQAAAPANGEREGNIWLGLKNSGLLDEWDLPEQ
jgi:phospholipase C